VCQSIGHWRIADDLFFNRDDDASHTGRRVYLFFNRLLVLLSSHARRRTPMDETLVQCRAAGTEVGSELVLSSPLLSLTGGPLSTRHCCQWMAICPNGFTTSSSD
jgi:hypothetical protein